jgi:hypothetical protein
MNLGLEMGTEAGFGTTKIVIYVGLYNMAMDNPSASIL